jgi:hypothetical protein
VKLPETVLTTAHTGVAENVNGAVPDPFVEYPFVVEVPYVLVIESDPLRVTGAFTTTVTAISEYDPRASVTRIVDV